VVLRLGAWIAAIASLAAVSIFASITVAKLSSGEARAINLAGSLRMQSYAIGAAVAQGDARGIDEAIAEFETRFTSPDLTRTIPHGADESLRRAYDAVGSVWRGRFHPAVLKAATEVAAGQPGGGRLSAETAEIVTAINQLVVLIEHGLEDKLQLLRLVQGISLVLLVIVGAAAVLQLKQKVLLPLHDLLASADRVRRSDFSVRVPIREPDELGQLGEAFNFMVEDLSRSYAQLENRVREKTEELARSNQSLNLLYRTTRALSERAVTRATLQQVLEDVEQVIGVKDGAICLARGDEPEAACRTGTDGPSFEALCRACCEGCATGGSAITLQPRASGADGGQMIAAPLFDGSRNHGALLLALPPGQALAPWQLELLETVGRHVGAALASTQRNEERHRLALLDERSVIARELHDSLAQSLSYLKIQVTRLQALLRKSPTPEPVTEIVGELRDGLNEAYRQLRELLTTFRLRIDGRGLNAAIDDTVQEFRRRTGLEISLDNRLAGVELAANREIHVLQIIREALTNIERHAKAGQVAIALARNGAERLRVTVDDDGVGFDEADRPLHRYGIVIMHDRAQSLAGEISVRPREGGGTRVELDFPADAHLSDSPTSSQGSVS
jgi:two-component system nitrate/nitrite sensor histidine kinase NarX